MTGRGQTAAGTSADATARAGAIAGRITVVAIAAAALIVLSLSFDARIALAAKSLSPDAVAWGRFISAIGMSGWMFATSAVLTVGPLLMVRSLRTRRFDMPLRLLAERSSYVFATLATQALAAQLVKHLVGRARPKLFPDIGPYSFDVLSMKSALASFPSGHTATAFSMAVALTLIAPRLRVALFTLAIAIATSRMVVQAHYLSDVLAGCALGVGTALLVARVFADKRVAFLRSDGRLMLKGPGLIAATLAGQRSAGP